MHRPSDTTHKSGLEVVILVGKVVWENLPLLLAMDIVLAAVVCPVIILALTGGSLLAPLAGVLTIGPVWAGTVATTDRMVRDQEVSWFVFVRSIRHYATIGIEVSLIPGIVVTAGLGTLLIFDANPRETWLIFPLIFDGSVVVAILLAQSAVFSLATTGKLRRRHLWQTAFGVVASRPVMTLGLLALLLMIWLIVSLSGPGFLPFFPAPLAVYQSASTWASIDY